MDKEGEEGEAAGDFHCLFVLFCIILVILIIDANKMFSFRNEFGFVSSIVMLKTTTRETNLESALPSTSTIYSSEPKLKKPGSPPFPPWYGAVKVPYVICILKNGEIVLFNEVILHSCLLIIFLQ